MDKNNKLLMVELNIPRYVHIRINEASKRTYKDVIKEVSRSRKSGITRVFIEDCPRGWWVALKILREGTG